MSWVGAVSASIATICSLISLCMFFKTEAAIKFAVILSIVVLLVVILGVLVTILRWIQVLSNTVMGDKCGWYLSGKRKFRILFIALGTICVIGAVFSSAGVFIFAKRLDGISSQILNATAENNETTEPVAVEAADWHVAACKEDPNGTVCLTCGTCESTFGCDVCQGDARVCERCDCGTSSKTFCRLAKGRYKKPAENGTEEEKKSPLDQLSDFLGEPDEDSQCYNISYGLRGIKRKFCQLYELTDSFHCRNGTDTILPEEIVSRLRCIAHSVNDAADKRLIVAVFLVLGALGFLLHTVVAIWWNGDKQTGHSYKKAGTADS